jgi:hypothetical protein
VIVVFTLMGLSLDGLFWNSEAECSQLFDRSVLLNEGCWVYSMKGVLSYLYDLEHRICVNRASSVAFQEFAIDF